MPPYIIYIDDESKSEYVVVYGYNNNMCTHVIHTNSNLKYAHVYGYKEPEPTPNLKCVLKSGVVCNTIKQERGVNASLPSCMVTDAHAKIVVENGMIKITTE